MRSSSYFASRSVRFGELTEFLLNKYSLVSFADLCYWSIQVSRFVLVRVNPDFLLLLSKFGVAELMRYNFLLKFMRLVLQKYVKRNMESSANWFCELK